MCTLTWWRDAKSYGVWFNRDEKKTRPIAEPPTRHTSQGVQYLTPRDPAGGGTWILVNEYGTLICLLNRWHEENGGVGGSRSRGELPLRFVTALGTDEVEEMIYDTSLKPYRPFSLFVMDSTEEFLWQWDGRFLVSNNPRMPLTSSSYEYKKVREARRARFAEGLRGDVFHRSAGETPSAETVRMCRPDAQTWSRSKVTVGNSIEWEYLAEKPDLIGDPDQYLVHLR